MALVRKSLQCSLLEYCTYKPHYRYLSVSGYVPENRIVIEKEKLAPFSQTQKLNTDQTLKSLYSLYQGEKLRRDLPSYAELSKTSSFIQICTNVQNHANKMIIPERIEALKILSFFGVSIRTNVSQTILQLIRHDINELDINEIIFLDFLLDKNESSVLSECLQKALPLIFRTKLDLELETADVSLLKDMLSYCSKTETLKSCLNEIINRLALHGRDIDIECAKSIVWSMIYLNTSYKVNPIRSKLLHHCFNIISQNINEMSEKEILVLLKKIQERYSKKHKEFYSKSFLDSCATYTIGSKMNFEYAVQIAKILSKMAHTNLDLLEYISNSVVSNPGCLQSSDHQVLKNLVASLAHSNYAPKPVLEVIQKHLHSYFSSEQTVSTIKFCLDLAILNVFDQQLLNKILSDANLNTNLRYNGILDFTQLLMLNETVKAFFPTYNGGRPSDHLVKKAWALYPRSKSDERFDFVLAESLGGRQYFAHNVQISCGVIIDYLIGVDNNGKLVPFSKDNICTDVTLIDDLQLPSGVQKLAILLFEKECYSINCKRLRGVFHLLIRILEHHAFYVLALSKEEMAEKSHEVQTLYLEREINYKLKLLNSK